MFRLIARLQRRLTLDDARHLDTGTALDGDLPINTGGGLLAFGHPVGATGVKQILEVARQLTGKCGDYQIATPPKHGITANMGGDDRTSVSVVLRNNAA